MRFTTRFDESEKDYSRAIEIHEWEPGSDDRGLVEGDESFATAVRLYSLARALQQLDRISDAEELMLRSLVPIKAQRGKAHAHTEHVRQALRSVQDEMKRPSSVRKLDYSENC